MLRVLTTSISSSSRTPPRRTVLPASAAHVGATNKVSASAKPQPASMRWQRSDGDFVEIVIKLNIDMVPTNLSSKLDWPGCRAARQLYHTRVFVLGKIELMCGIFATPAHILWKKVTGCVCTSGSAR